MPVIKNKEIRLKVLNDCLRNPYKEYTIDDLVEKCNKVLRDKKKQEVSKRTIQNDIEELQLEPYEIKLKKNFRSGHKVLYRYADTDYSLPLFDIDDEERNKIQEAIYVLKQYEGEPQYDWARALLMQVEGEMIDEDATPVVSFQTNQDLKGLQHFEPLLKAIMAKHVLKLRYTPFGKETLTVNIYPYFLKQYNYRWYLIAQAVGYDKYAHYPLDRIDDFTEIAIPYKEAEEDFEEYFDDVVGITIPECEAQDIIIKVSKESMGFVLTKPLHLSQRIVEKTDDSVTIKINVKPNFELDALILSFGPNVEVLAPESYRAYISEKIKQMNEKYLTDK